VVDVVLVFRSGQKAGSYLLASALLVNVLSIHADDANNVDDVDDVDNVDELMMPTMPISLRLYYQQHMTEACHLGT
jgi:hypothetical protein